MSLADMAARRVSPPNWTYTLRHEAPLRAGGPPPKLALVSKKRNKITDDEQWFATHGIRLPVWQVPIPARRTKGNLPAHFPDRYRDLLLVEAIAHADHTVLLFGPDYSGGTVLAVIEPGGNVRALFDFETWRWAPTTTKGDEDFVDQRINWAQVQDSVLYLSSGHRTYAHSSGGHNAYISAIDLDSGELLWRSQPLVANSTNFLLRAGWIITGYGFTDEPDFLYVLDARTGKAKTKLKVRSGPNVLLERDGQLYMRCYNTDYVFDIR